MTHWAESHDVACQEIGRLSALLAALIGVVDAADHTDIDVTGAALGELARLAGQCVSVQERLTRTTGDPHG